MKEALTSMFYNVKKMIIASDNHLFVWIPYENRIGSIKKAGVE